MSERPASVRWSVGRRELMLTLAAVGFAVNFWAWALLSPLAPRFKDALHLSPFQQALLVAVPVVVGSLGRIPVGALTDRFGGRVMFPLVSLTTIVPVLYLGLSGHASLAGLLVGGFFLGIGGTAFAVGVPFVNAWFPPARRGLAIGLFGMGMGGTAISALTTVNLVKAHGTATPFVVTAVVLAGYAAIAALLLRDAPGRPIPVEPLSRRLAATLRLEVTWQAAIIYAVVFGGYVAFSVYLPAYLRTAYGLTQTDAANRMAGFVLLAVLMRPVGGWLSDRLGPTRVLAGALGVICAGAAVQSFTPGLKPLGTIAFLSMAAALGAGSGATFALVALLAPGNKVGSVTGVVGAAGGLGGFLPPLVMGFVYGQYGSYAIGLMLLALVAAGTLLLTNTVVARTVRASGGISRPERAALDNELTNALVRTRRFFTRGEVSPDLRALQLNGGRRGDSFYRDRWSHDKVVRSTHGVNCTGSCSWKVYVKDGIITWEAQQTDYPSVGPDRPEYEPRGCPRGAAFSWYTYSPTRVRYPYVRGVLLELYRAAKARVGDPVDAWASIVEDSELARRYKSVRGKGGLVRASWDEVTELIAAAHIHTIKKYGPDRVAGFSPIPAMSMVSHAAGARFYNLIGAAMLSFYDWYADLPVASPQMFGDQTDVPESGDWWDAGYLIMWGANLPVTRTPDAHWMAEARYRGQKVVAIAPDYADNVKFADEWLHAVPGTDAALAMAMGHVILREFFVDRQVEYFTNYVKRFTDLPFLVSLEPEGDAFRPGKLLTAADLPEGSDVDNAPFKTVMLDSATGEPVVPNGSLGFRYGDAGVGRWNLDLGEIDPLLSAAGDGEPDVEVRLPRFDAPSGAAEDMRRGVPVRRIGGRLVTTVYDLLLAQYGVARPGLPGEWPASYLESDRPYTPAWQESITGVPAATVERIAREFAENAEQSRGRSMIIMGAGTNHWFHSDTIYRSLLALTTLTGCQGVNGGGWAHYVGQEKVRPITGYSVLGTASDWSRPGRQMVQTAYWYLNSDQFRYDPFSAATLASGSVGGAFAGLTTADLIAASARMGWMPSYPSFNRNPLDLVDEATATGRPVDEYIVDGLTSGQLRFACEDPDAPENFPRVLTVWRANLLGSSAKGNEYFLRHLLGTDHAVRASEAPVEARPRDVVWRDEAPTGKLDLLLSLDFRMTSTTIYSDVVLPAATWYEKHDLSTTDMHPFVHSFNPAISPPWQTRTDWDAFIAIARAFSRLAAGHLGTRTDVVAAPLLHDTPDEMAYPHGRVLDWKAGQCTAVPGRTMPRLVRVERDYAAIADKMTALGPLVDTLGATTKGITFSVAQEVEYLRRRNGTVRGGPADGRPSIARDVQACEAILALSGTTNGHLATQGFRTLERQTGVRLADLSAEHEGKQITFADTQSQPVPVITSPEWSGSEAGGRRYSPFVINVERGKPWHTLTGRQSFFLDHDWISEVGEWLPVYRPPLNMQALFGEPQVGQFGELGITVRYLTPHNKWSIHSEYQDNLFMLSLSRGGQTIWMSTQDAAKIGVRDNDWVEAVNRNGVVVARAVVSHRMPEGTVYMHHAQDRLIDVPRTETTGRRGGIHNSLTRLIIKPTHLIGGYAQLSFAFNYLGPTGNQRDEVTMIRRRSQEVEY